MKKILIFTILITAFIFNSARGEVVDKIAVIVNNEIITQSEIDRASEPIYEQYRAVYYGDELVKKLEEARQGVIEQLIEDKLVLSEAKRLNIEVDERDVEEKLEEIKRRFNSTEEFETAIRSQNLTVKDLKTRYKEQLMGRKLINEKVGSKIIISPIEIQDYYNAHINSYVQSEELGLRNILIRPKKGLEVQQALNLAKDILKRIREGGDFEALAKEYSEGPNAKEGGLMGYVKKGDLLPEIENVVFNMKAGDISDVIQTSLGYHIFKVEEKKERRTFDLSEVRHDVEDAIFREKIKGKVKGWIEGLKKNAYIACK